MKLDELMKDRGKFWIMVIAGMACFFTAWILVEVPYRTNFIEYASSGGDREFGSFIAKTLPLFAWLIFILIRAAFVYFLFYRLTFLKLNLYKYLVVVTLIVILTMIATSLLVDQSIESLLILYIIYACLIGAAVLSFYISSSLFRSVDVRISHRYIPLYELTYKEWIVVMSGIVFGIFSVNLAFVSIGFVYEDLVQLIWKYLTSILEV